MKEEIKSKLSTYAVGGVGGAIIVLILGFWVGPLTTNGAMAEAVDGAIVEQQALFCAERARLDPAYIDATAFGERDSNAQRDFATRFAAFEGQTTSSTRAVVNACRGLLEEV